jgi:hypothetical protein
LPEVHRSSGAARASTKIKAATSSGQTAIEWANGIARGCIDCTTCPTVANLDPRAARARVSWGHVLFPGLGQIHAAPNARQRGHSQRGEQPRQRNAWLVELE